MKRKRERQKKALFLGTKRREERKIPRHLEAPSPERRLPRGDTFAALSRKGGEERVFMRKGRKRKRRTFIYREKNYNGEFGVREKGGKGEGKKSAYTQLQYKKK